MSTNNANPSQGVARSKTGLSQFATRAQQEPWAPIILSLDGGGIKGLSELFILRRIMKKIQAQIELDERNNVANANPFLILRSDNTNASEPIPLLPCYFFDYMIGTSTGGLIAVMLGRLRMSIDECIKAYWRLGTKIFFPRRRIRTYSSAKLENAINEVVSQNCGDNQSRRGDAEPFRQYDYAEHEYTTYNHDASRQNFTCKVAVLAQKLEDDSQVLYLFRTYDHRRRDRGDPLERNPKTLENSRLKIWEACRATTAAPFYFSNMVINGKRYLDGGAGHNNPSKVAWMEAECMAISDPNSPQNNAIAGIVSLGCGEKRGRNIFGDRKNPFFLRKVFKYGTSKMTNTQEAHDDTTRLARDKGSSYFRFSVKPGEGRSEDKGLKGIKFHECKRKSKRPLRTLRNEISPPAEHSHFPEWYTKLRASAVAPLERREKGDFKPDKYFYPTYDTIFIRTENYCEYSNADTRENISNRIDACALMLLEYARARQAQDPDRWIWYLSHPNPDHHMFISTPNRPHQAGDVGN